MPQILLDESEVRRASRDWKEAMNQFAVLYAERFTKPTP